MGDGRLSLSVSSFTVVPLAKAIDTAAVKQKSFFASDHLNISDDVLSYFQLGGFAILSIR